MLQPRSQRSGEHAERTTVIAMVEQPHEGIMRAGDGNLLAFGRGFTTCVAKPARAAARLPITTAAVLPSVLGAIFASADRAVLAVP